MPVNIVHIHLAFCSPINSILCQIFSVILTFKVFPLLKRENHQTITQNLEQTQPNTKVNKDCAVFLNVLLGLNPHYSTKNIHQPTIQSIMSHTKESRTNEELNKVLTSRSPPQSLLHLANFLHSRIKCIQKQPEMLK